MKRQKKLMRRIAAFAAAAVLFAASGMSALADAQGTVIPASANVRQSADANSQVIMSVKAGNTLTIKGQTSGSDGNKWFQVTDGTQTGYMRADLLKVNGTLEGTPVSEETPTQTSAEVTAADAATATVISSSVNVRSGPATSDSVAASAKQGTVMTILGQTTGADGNKWYQVSFNSNGSDVTGFVRADIVEASGEPAAAETPEDGAQEGETPETPEESQPEGSEGHTEVSNVLSSRILPLDADPTKMEIDESKLEEWESGNYYLLYLVDTNGQNRWYLYTLSDQKLEQIDLLTGEEAAGNSGGGLGKTSILLLAVLAVLSIGLLIAVIVLAMRLRELRWNADYEGDEGDYGDEDEPYEDGRVNSRRWRPRNFLQEEEDDDEPEEIDEDDLEADVIREYEERRARRRPPVRQSRGREDAYEEDGRGQEGQRRAPQGARGQEGQRRAPQEARGEGQRRAPQEARGEGQRRAPQEARGEGQRRAPQEARGEGQRRAPQEARGEGQRRAPQETRGQEGQRRAPQQRSGEAGAPRQDGRRNAAPDAQGGRRPAPRPQPRPAAYADDDDDDDEFEFEFLNMDGKEDL